jgi:hypothetical protein
VDNDWQQPLMRDVDLPDGWALHPAPPSDVLRVVGPSRPEDLEQEPESEWEYVSTHIEVVPNEDGTFLVQDFEVQCSRDDPHTPQDRPDPGEYFNDAVTAQMLPLVVTGLTRAKD